MRPCERTTKREAVNPRRLAVEPLTPEGARATRGIGWDGDLAELRGDPR